MQQFRIKPEGFNEIRKKILYTRVPFILLVSIIGIAISQVNSKDNENAMLVWIITIPLMVISVSIGFNRGMKRQRKLYESYLLSITSNLITREQFNTATVSIYFNEIQRVTKGKDGGFVIQGKESADIIIVPPQIEDIDMVEQFLNNISPISQNANSSFLQKNQVLVSIVVLGSMICTYTVTNKLIVFICGSITISFMLRTLYEIQKSKNYDRKIKRSSWWILMVVASLAGVMIIKITGTPH